VKPFFLLVMKLLLGGIEYLLPSWDDGTKKKATRRPANPCYAASTPNFVSFL